MYYQISHKTNGLVMAFGAGALLFAVAIEMFAAGASFWCLTSSCVSLSRYGPSSILNIGLRELDEGEDASNMHTLVAFSVVGAVFYTLVRAFWAENRILSNGAK
jgi:hypothetical protein